MQNKIYFQQIGKGPDMVLLHGWGFHSGIWQNITEQLQAHYRLTIVDLPGFGNSPTLNDYSMENLAQALLAIAPEQAIWLGWSLGGLIATYSAQQFPERITGLINIATSPYFMEQNNWPGMKQSVLEQFAEQLSNNMSQTLQHFIALQFHGMKGAKPTIRELNSIFAQGNHTDTTTLNHGLHLLKTIDLRKNLNEIKCPLHYILGRLDALVPTTMADELNTLHDNCTITIIDKASHAPFISHPEQVIDHIHTFMNKTIGETK